MVLGFGFASLLADMVYEGARSLYGPVLTALGASAAVVGLVTGLGEAMALVLRLVAGPTADRRGAHWSFTMVGYAMTAICVPLLAVSPQVGAAGLVFASTLILLERTGKAVRSPSKSALLAHAAGAVGRGKGFGVHKALDQIGAFSGPLSVAAIIAAAGSIWPGFAWLIVPGIAALVVLFWLRHRAPDLTIYDPPEAKETLSPRQAQSSWWRDALGADLPPSFYRYALAASLTTGGLVTFAVMSVHLTRNLGFSTAWIPVIYAFGMLAEAAAGLVNGWQFDKRGARVLLVVPVLVALVPPLVFGTSQWVALLGVAVWGFAYGIQDSTIKALVADLVPASQLATAYGIFAAIQGIFAVLGGFLAGWLLDRSILGLIVVIAASQAVAFVLLSTTAHKK